MNELDEYITKRDAIKVIEYPYLDNLTRDERVHEIESLPSANVIPITEIHDVYMMSNTKTVFSIGNRKFMVTEII